VEDFSLGCHERFWTAFEAFHAEASAPDVVALLPSIKVTIDFTYDLNAPDLGPLSECIVDLDPNCSEARLVLTYGPRPTAPTTLFADLTVGDDAAVSRSTLFRALGSRVPGAYAASLEAVDPNDPTNRKSLEPKTLTAIVRGGFINAQRGLDDDTHRERDVLGKVVEAWPFSTTQRSAKRGSGSKMLSTVLKAILSNPVLCLRHMLGRGLMRPAGYLRQSGWPAPRWLWLGTG
jgi:hypothetical protein